MINDACMLCMHDDGPAARGSLQPADPSTRWYTPMRTYTIEEVTHIVQQGSWTKQNHPWQAEGQTNRVITRRHLDERPGKRQSSLLVDSSSCPSRGISRHLTGLITGRAIEDLEIHIWLVLSSLNIPNPQCFFQFCFG